ncbi:hypothetical protein PHYBOEH_002233 [Phytophthora boehmeriae]|uniref:Elicitin n=1 Tax=Phytophthora boehmeriae TaxID=109152 RepID=A0A8T1WRE3_9STRA|nr:hypothetical protein PHYBOEH_002233 [Phytophthora boehmeriae]
MRFMATTIVIMTLLATGAMGATPFCTQAEKQLANKLHEQNTEPAKSCYRAANGDITTLATSRLCPLPECATWLAYMAQNSPNCFYDSTNYADEYALKNADCTGDTNGSGSEGSSTTSRESGSSANGSDSSNSSANATSEDRTASMTHSVVGSVEGSVAGEITSFVGSGDMASTSGNVDEANTPTPTPTDDLTTKDSPPPELDSSSGSTSTPTPTNSASVVLPALSGLATLFVLAAIPFI